MEQQQVSVGQLQKEIELGERAKLILQLNEELGQAKQELEEQRKKDIVSES